MGTGSMLAWVCWDEFVNLENPYSVRWMEKCNEGHIAALEKEAAGGKRMVVSAGIFVWQEWGGRFTFILQLTWN